MARLGPDAAADFGALMMAQNGMNVTPAPWKAPVVQAAADGDASEGEVHPDELTKAVIAVPPKVEEAEMPNVLALLTAVDATPVLPQSLPVTAGQGLGDKSSSATQRAPVSDQGDETAAQTQRPFLEPLVERKTLPETSADEDETLDDDTIPQQSITPQFPVAAPSPTIASTPPSQITESMQAQALEGPQKGAATALPKPVATPAPPGIMPSSDAKERKADETAPDGQFVSVHDKSTPTVLSALQEQGATAKLEGGDSGLPSPLLTQTLAPAASKPAGSLYPLGTQIGPHAPVVQAQPGRMGADIGVQIAKAVKGEREDLLIRLDPREMGRIDVRLSFDRDGLLRAVLSADNSTALDILRRESGDLNRALTDAGVRADGQSLRFDTRSGDGHAHHSRERDQPTQDRQSGQRESIGDLADPTYRPLRASGHVDLMA